MSPGIAADSKPRTWTSWIAGLAALVMMAATLAGVTSLTTTQPASASALAPCNGTVSNGLAVTPSHGQVMYINTGNTPVLDAAYVGYEVKNSGSERRGLWVEISDFTGGVIGLANPRDRTMPLDALANNASQMAYFLVKATRSTTTPQTHTIKVWDARPDSLGAQVLASCSYSFDRVRETIRASANQVTSITAPPSIPSLGNTFSVEVKGETGVVGNGTLPDGAVLWFTPAGLSTWPTRAFRLESSSISFSRLRGGGGSCVRDNQLRITLGELQKGCVGVNNWSGVKSFAYTANYTFRVIGTPPLDYSIAPIAQIASGSQVKHTDTTSTAFTDNSSVESVAAPISLSIAKSLNLGSASLADLPRTQVVNGVAGDDTFAEVPFALTVTTGGSTTVSVDEIVDEANSALVYKVGSANIVEQGVSRSLSTPTSTTSGATTNYNFAGPFKVSDSQPLTVTYTMYVPLRDDTFSNVAFVRVGDQVVGKTGSTLPKLTLQTSAEGVESSTEEVLFISPEVSTLTVTGVTDDSAVLHGSIDPNGTEGLAAFEYSTSATFASSVSVTASSPANGAVSGDNPVATRVTLLNLTPGQTYFYRSVYKRAGEPDVVGDTLSFTTTQQPAPPTAITLSASNVTETGATLNGSVDPNLTPSNVRFLYSTNASLSSPTTVTLTEVVAGESSNSDDTQNLIVEGNSAQDFSLSITDLEPNTTYHFAIEAVPVDGSTAVRGNVVSFIPGGQLPAPPTVSDASMSTDATTPVSTTPTVTVGDSATWDAAASCLVEPASGDCVKQVDSPSRGTWTVDAAGAVSFTAAVGFAGDDSITYRGFDNFGQFGSATVSVTVMTSALSLTTASTPAGTVQASYGPVSLSAEGGTGSYTAWSVTAGALPAGLSLDANTGVISGTPEVPGSSTFTVQVTDSNSATATRVFTIDISGPLAISTATTLPPGVEDVLYTQTFAAGGGTPPYTKWEVAAGSSLPAGLNLDAGTGVLTGTPAQDGTYTFTIAVTDTGNTTVSKVFTLVVEAQAVVETRDFQVVAGGKIRLRGKVNPKGANTSALFEYWPKGDDSVITQTPLTNLSGSNDTDVEFDVPGLSLDTEYDYRIKASNSRGTRMAQSSFRTPARPSAAIGASDILSVTETTARIRGRVNAKRGLGPAQVTVTPRVVAQVAPIMSSFFVSAAQIEPQSTITVAATDPCQGDVTVGGETEENLECDLTGLTPGTTYDVEVTVNNGFADDTATYSFTTLNAVTPPSITTSSPLVAGTVGSPYSITFAASGGTGTYTAWSVTAGSLPTGLTVNDQGQLSGTPSTEGIFTFTVRVTDSANATADKVFSLTVNAAPAPAPPAPPAPVPPAPEPTPAPSDDELQLLTFTPIADQPLSIIPIMAMVSSNSTAAAITVTSSTPSVCQVSGASVQMIAVGTCTLTASSPAHDGFTAAESITRSFRITTPPIDTVYDSRTDTQTVLTTPGETIGIPIPPSTTVEVPVRIRNASSVTIDNETLRVTTRARWTGILQIPVLLVSDHSTVAITLRITVRPDGVRRATYEPTSATRTVLRWQAVRQGTVRYVVSVNGRVACRTTRTTCAVRQLLGPNSNVTVTVQGGNRTRSAVVTARYAPRKPVRTTVIYFGFDSSALTRDSRRSLNQLARIIAREGFSTLRVEGHTDGIGSQTYNLALSQRRIDAAVRYLSRKLTGLDVDTRALGKLVAAATNTTAEGRALNRRVEFFVR